MTSFPGLDLSNAVAIRPQDILPTIDRGKVGSIFFFFKKAHPLETQLQAHLYSAAQADSLWKPGVGDTGSWTARMAFRARGDIPAPTAQPVLHSGKAPLGLELYGQMRHQGLATFPTAK